MKDVVAWINARDYFYNNDRDIIESCFILNFGFNDELPYPQIMPDLDSISPLLVPGTGNLNGDWGMNLPSACSVVIISGKYLDIIDQVMKKIDDITEEIAHMPLAVFLVTDSREKSKTLNIDTSMRKVSKVPDHCNEIFHCNNKFFSRKATLELALSVCPFVCLSVCYTQCVKFRSAERGKVR